MKKFLAMLLALVMALSLVACGEKKDDTKTEGGDTATGSVYYLNFKPESDNAWKALAATYTEKTGVPVKILTAASGEYESTLVSEMDKEDAPTLFQCNEGGVATWGEFCYDLSSSDVYNQLTSKDYALKNADGEVISIGYCLETYGIIVNKALLKEAGYEDTNDDGILEKDGTSLAIHFNYSQSLASVDNAVLSIAASLKELGFDVTIDAVDMNTWYGALMAGEYDLTFYNTAGGSFDPATDMSNMAPGAMGDPILCQFSAFFENPEIFAELDSTSDSRRVQEIYGMILNGIADQNLLVPVTGTHDLALWNTDKITGYDFYTDASYVDIASVHVK